MDSRKLVKSGNSSYTVALPIDWVRKYKLDKGSLIGVSESEIGDLVFSAGKRDEENTQKKIISIKIDGKDPEAINLELLNAYFRDYQTIILEGKDVNKMNDKIASQIKSFIGLDIIEQTKDGIIVKNFSSEDKELSPRPLIKKLDISIREMINILSGFFESGFSKDSFFELQKVKEQNERIYSLTRKAILKGMEDPYFMRKLQTTYHQLSKDKVVAGILNNLSNLFESLGKSFLYLEHTKKDTLSLKNVFDVIEEEYRLILNTMKYKNYSEIFDSISKHNKGIYEIERYRKEFKNPLMLEAMTYVLVIKNVLNHLAFEIIE